MTNENISFNRPTTIKEAAILMQKKDSFALAGGTDFIVKFQNRMLGNVKQIVDLNLLNLTNIVQGDNEIIIEACCTMEQISSNALIKESFPTLAYAAASVGALQIRNMATIGGNIANASPAGDSIPALYSLNAQLSIYSEEKSYRIPIENFFAGPGKTVLKPGELIESIIIPRRKTAGCFLKLGERKAHAISKINLALSTWQQDGKNKYSVALGSVAPTVIKCPEVEKLLSENSINENIILKAAQMASEAASPISDVRSSSAYRKQMAKVLMQRALRKVHRDLQ